MAAFWIQDPFKYGHTELHSVDYATDPRATIFKWLFCVVLESPEEDTAGLVYKSEFLHHEVLLPELNVGVSHAKGCVGE